MEPPNCFNCQQRDQSEWCVLKHDDTQKLQNAKICNTYQPGQIIFYQGNPCLGIYCIESGTVAVRKTDAQGNSVIVRMLHEGQTLGYRAYFEGKAYSASAEALTETRICFIDRAAVSDLLSHNPSLGINFLRHIAEDLRESEEARMDAVALPARVRVVHLLLALKDRWADVDEEGTMHIHLPLARKDMAAMVGIRPETLARILHDLEAEGVAHFDGPKVRVPDLDVLLDEIEPPA